MCADDLLERSIVRAKATRSAELAQVESTGRDDLPERCDLARESNSERELAQVESTGCFQRKLSSERVAIRASLSVDMEHLPENLRRLLLFW